MKISLGNDGINICIADNTSDVEDISIETSQDTETKNTQKMNRASKISALGYLPVKLNSYPYSSSSLACKADSLGLPGLSHPLLNLRSLVGSTYSTPSCTVAWKLFQVVQLGNHKTHLIYFLSFRGHWTSLPDVQCLEND